MDPWTLNKCIALSIPYWSEETKWTKYQRWDEWWDSSNLTCGPLPYYFPHTQFVPICNIITKDRSKAGLRNFVLRQKLDNGHKSPPPPKKKLWYLQKSCHIAGDALMLPQTTISCKASHISEGVTSQLCLQTTQQLLQGLRFHFSMACVNNNPTEIPVWKLFPAVVSRHGKDVAIQGRSQQSCFEGTARAHTHTLNRLTRTTHTHTHTHTHT